MLRRKQLTPEIRLLLSMYRTAPNAVERYKISKRIRQVAEGEHHVLVWVKPPIHRRAVSRPMRVRRRPQPIRKPVRQEESAP